MSENPTCRDLCRPKIDIVLNTILLFAIVVSFIPQTVSIARQGNTVGIAPMYVLCHYLFAATQFTMILILSCAHFPVINCIQKGQLKGLDSYGASLGLIQIAGQWLGSMSIVVLFLIYPHTPTISSMELDPMIPSPPSEQLPNLGVSGERVGDFELVAALCICHGLILVVPAISIAMQPDRRDSLGSLVFMGLFDMICIPISICLVVSQFPPQIKSLLATDGLSPQKSSLSMLTVISQSVIFTLLGFSWYCRLGPRGKGFNRIPRRFNNPFTWYYMSAWPWLNNTIFGIGQGVLAAIFLHRILT